MPTKHIMTPMGIKLRALYTAFSGYTTGVNTPCLMIMMNNRLFMLHSEANQCSFHTYSVKPSPQAMQ